VSHALGGRQRGRRRVQLEGGQQAGRTLDTRDRRHLGHTGLIRGGHRGGIGPSRQHETRARSSLHERPAADEGDRDCCQLSTAMAAGPTQQDTTHDGEERHGRGSEEKEWFEVERLGGRGLVANTVPGKGGTCFTRLARLRFTMPNSYCARTAEYM
jgi:hypothetical protein